MSFIHIKFRRANRYLFKDFKIYTQNEQLKIAQLYNIAIVRYVNICIFFSSVK